MPKLLLTPVEAAQVLGIGRTKVYELIITRALDSAKIGTCRRIPADALSAFVDSLMSDTPDWQGQRTPGLLCIRLGAFVEPDPEDNAANRA